MRVLRTLKDKRDMSLNEVKLTVAIEDPTKREQKEYMGIEVALIPVPEALLEGRETCLACARQQGRHPCKLAGSISFAYWAIQCHGQDFTSITRLEAAAG